MINMRYVQLETINVHQLMQSNDLLGHCLWPPEEQGPVRRDEILNGSIRHRWPATLPTDLGKRTTVGRQELRACRALVAEHIPVAVHSERRTWVMFAVLQGLALELDMWREGRQPATDDRERHRQTQSAGPND
jgi:hypothetical protein